MRIKNALLTLILYPGITCVLTLLPQVFKSVDFPPPANYYVNEIVSILIIPSYLAVVTNACEVRKNIDEIANQDMLIIVAIFSVLLSIGIIYENPLMVFVGNDTIAKLIAIIIISLALIAYFALYFIIKNLFLGRQ